MSEKSSTPAKPEETKPRRPHAIDLFTQMQSEFDRFWGERWPAFRARRPSEFAEDWTPRTDVYEQNGSLVVKAELPGVKKEDIELTIEDGDLIIRGERHGEEKVEEKDYYRLERFQGSFYRRLPLPEGVDPEQIQAVYEDGILRLTIQKPAAAIAEPKKITIR